MKLLEDADKVFDPFFTNGPADGSKGRA